MTRYGVRFENDPSLTPQDLQELGVLAEELGYETVWAPEGGGRDSLTALAAIALRTERVRLGTGILPIYARTATNTAMGAAGMAAVSGDRFILGLGVGHRPTVEGRDGVPFRQPMARLRETISIVRGLLSGENVAYEGRHFNIASASLGGAAPTGAGAYLHRRAGASDAGAGRRDGRRRADELDRRELHQGSGGARQARRGEGGPRPIGN